MPANSPPHPDVPGGASRSPRRCQARGQERLVSERSATTRNTLQPQRSLTCFRCRHLHSRYESEFATALRPGRPQLPKPALPISWNTRAWLLYTKCRLLSTSHQQLQRSRRVGMSPTGLNGFDNPWRLGMPTWTDRGGLAAKGLGQ